MRRLLPVFVRSVNLTILTMAIFSRRDVQGMINSLADSLSAKQVEDLVGKLNNGDSNEILATEWETVILAAFRQIGRVQYERDFGGGRRPDLFFQMGESGNFEFIADITTVSDADAHDSNAYEEFCEAIRRFLHKRGHIGAGINVDVVHQETGEYRDSKIKLLLPPKGEINQFVKSELGWFLSQITKEPDKDAVLKYDRKEIRFSILYNSKEKRFSGGHHIDYTVPYSERRNPLMNSLRRKREQLSKSGFTGLRGIIVCDGNCEALKERNAVAGMHGCSEIIEPFLKSYKSVLFVLVLRIEEKHTAFSFKYSIQICPKLYWNFATDKSLFGQTKRVLDRMLNKLPIPESTPRNAIRWLARNRNIGRPLGGYSMKGNTIKISARALTELLAGKIEPEQFLKEHGFRPIQEGHKAIPFFEIQLEQGNLLKNAFVEPDEHKDDDWIVLEYAGPDPAISPFRIPK